MTRRAASVRAVLLVLLAGGVFAGFAALMAFAPPDRGERGAGPTAPGAGSPGADASAPSTDRPVNGSPPASSDAFVTRSGARLLLDGRPYRFVGMNIYNANSDGYCRDAMDDGALEAALDEIGLGGDRPGVIRAWFFQPLAAEKWTGERTWSRFDRTIAVARERGYKVIATLADQWGECGDTGLAGFKTSAWYRDGYRSPDPILADAYGGNWRSYRDWVSEVVERYRDDPTILAWQLINEAEVKPDQYGPCPPGTEPRDLLRAWAEDMAALVRSIAPRHLISLGTVGGGQCGTEGDSFMEIHAIPEIDLCEYHDYGDATPLPRRPPRDLPARIDQCRELDKPLFVGELGIRPREVGDSLEHRSGRIAEKLVAQSAAGVVGHLVWTWSEHGSTLDSFDVGAGDPVLELLRNVKVRLDRAARSGWNSLTLRTPSARTPGSRRRRRQRRRRR